MRFIPEVFEDINVIVEDAQNGPKQYFIEGVYIQADTPNRNGRIYPLHIIEKEVKRYKEQFIDTKRALGELGHPESGQINLDRASHLIVELRQEGNNFIGRAKILDTPMGKIAKNLIDEGVQLGVSTRGFGSLIKRKDGIQEVGEDFYLATVDAVFDPSGPNCFVNGIMENKEFYLSEGILMERDIKNLKKKVNDLSFNKKLDESAILKVFEEFMQGLK